MSKIAIVYWSGTGNTEQMARSVLAGAQNTGAAAELFTPEEFGAAMVEEYDGIAFGCPSMGAEELEESEFAPMFEACRGSLAGKQIALFGSYGWGDGEWMRTWEDDCRNAGATLVSKSVICQEQPDAEAEARCRALGAAFV